MNELKLLHHDDTGEMDFGDPFVDESAKNHALPKQKHLTDELSLEEVPFLLFLFPDLGVLVTVGTQNYHATILNAAHQQILNRRSVLYREISQASSAQFPSFASAPAAAPADAGGGGGARAAGCGALFVVVLDALMDAIFPVLDIFGDVVEGIQIINDSR